MAVGIANLILLPVLVEPGADTECHRMSRALGNAIMDRFFGL